MPDTVQLDVCKKRNFKPCANAYTELQSSILVLSSSTLLPVTAQWERVGGSLCLDNSIIQNA
jgi:hypothetical protein